MKRVKFIYNPSSGETLIADRLDDIISIYQRKGFSIVPYRLTFDGSMADMLGDVDHTYHHILVGGGDGTVNFVVNLMKEQGLDVPIAVLPAGTANDFATVLGLPSGIIKACRKIVSGEVHSIDLGKVNDKYFINVFSCGLFTDISQKTPTILKNTFGKLAYYVGGVAELPNFRRMHLTLRSDGGDYDDTCLIFFVFNGRTAGRLKLAYLSEIDDGKLDVIIFKGHGAIETVRTAIKYLPAITVNNLAQNKYPSGIEHIQCTTLTATSDSDEATDMDGQAGPRFPLKIECIKGGLKVIMPKK